MSLRSYLNVILLWQWLDWLWKPQQDVPSILEVASLDVVDWLKLEAAGPSLSYRSLPRTARQLLSGKGGKVYGSRSELEQAIVSSLVNNGFGFDEVLRLFRLYKPGKFTELDTQDPSRSVEWLRHSFDQARAWCVQILPGRKLASEHLTYAASIPWPGRTGSANISRASVSSSWGGHR